MAGTAKIFVSRGAGRKGGKKMLWRACVLKTRSEITRGIMRSPPRFQPALFLFPRSSRWRNAIHSFFCPPFDAVFINANKRVVDVRQVEPNKLLVVPRAPAKYLLELPAGEAAKKRVKPGEHLFFQFEERVEE